MLLISGLVIGYFIIVACAEYKQRLDEDNMKTCGDCTHCKYKMEYKDYILDSGADRSSSFIKDWYECDCMKMVVRKNRSACEKFDIKK